jgi:hypothetical protein
MIKTFIHYGGRFLEYVRVLKVRISCSEYTPILKSPIQVLKSSMIYLTLLKRIKSALPCVRGIRSRRNGKLCLGIASWTLVFTSKNE